MANKTRNRGKLKSFQSCTFIMALVVFGFFFWVTFGDESDKKKNR